MNKSLEKNSMFAFEQRQMIALKGVGKAFFKSFSMTFVGQTDRRKTCKNKLSSKKHTAAKYHHHHHHQQQHYHHHHSPPSPLITITEHNLQMVSGTRLMFSALLRQLKSKQDML
uniref:Uncharacterized protein n=1 Tax=Glossina pallidipes TaxID=7398 RepID=A0A1A9ZI58_GLOPL